MELLRTKILFSRNIRFVGKPPVISAKKFEKLLFSIGFEIKRQKGSHVFYKHPDGRYTTLPHHPGRDLSRALIHQILKEIKLPVEDFKTLLEKL